MRIFGRLFGPDRHDVSFTERIGCDLCGAVIFDRPPLLSANRYPEATVDGLLMSSSFHTTIAPIDEDAGRAASRDFCAKCTAVISDWLEGQGAKAPRSVERVYPRCSECNGTGRMSGSLHATIGCAHCNTTGFSHKFVEAENPRACSDPFCRDGIRPYGHCLDCHGTGFVDAKPEKPSGT